MRFLYRKKKKSLHIKISECKSTSLPSGVNLSGGDVVSQILQRKRKETTNTIPFSFFSVPPSVFGTKAPCSERKCRINSFQTLNHCFTSSPFVPKLQSTNSLNEGIKTLKGVIFFRPGQPRFKFRLML